MSRLITVPGAIICAILSIYFLWPEIKGVGLAISARPKLRGAIGIAILVLVMGGGYETLSRMKPVTRISLPRPRPLDAPQPPPPVIAVPVSPPTLPVPSGATLPPDLPIQSRMERFIYTCDVPPPMDSEEEAKQREGLQKNIRIWAASFGITVSFDDIDGGIKATAEAKTNEAKARFVSMGIMFGVTKVIAEIRRNGGQQIIVAYGELPKKGFAIFGITPDPSAKTIIDGRNLIARFLEVPESACRLI